MNCRYCGADHDASICPRVTNAGETIALDRPKAESPPTPPEKELLAGRFRIVARLGRGAMGDVFRAHDIVLEQPVALKFLPAQFAQDAQRVAVLLNEVRVARQVTHPNVCRVHDLFEDEGQRFLVMELIEGETLMAMLARTGSLPRASALSLARQICLGLAAAHDRGVVHRDLKPANILVDTHGVAHIADFGLAVVAPAVTDRHAREGTPSYMAPEALAGVEATARSDVYALGLVLCEIFTGKPTLAADARGLDGDIRRLIMRCLARVPAERPSSARAVADALPGGGTTLAALEAAQRRADRIAAFREELRELSAAGIVALDDAADARIASHHAAVLRDLSRDFDVDTSEREKQLSLGMKIVSILGALALAASVLFFFFRIWGFLSLPAQVAVLTIAPLSGLVATSLVAARDRSGHFAAMAAAFAFACFVADVLVLSTVFNQRASPFGFLAWAPFGLVLAYGHRLRLPLAAGLGAFGVFVATLFPWLAGCGEAEFFTKPEGFIVAGALAFAAPAFGAARRYPPFAAVYRALGALACLCPALPLSVAAEASFLPFTPVTIRVLYQLAGFVFGAAAVAMGVSSRYRETVYCGFAFLVVHLYTRCFHWWWDAMPRYLFFLLLATVAVVVLVVLRRLRSSVATWDEAGRP